MTLALLGTAGKAHGQPRYRLTPLIKLGFTPQVDRNGSLGINNKGQVVYGYVDANSATHAWVWLPSTDYGLSAGFHDLAAASSSSDDATSIARDINESGIVVGQSGTLVTDTTSGNGAAWTLASGTVTYTQLPLFSGGGISGAHAINDQSPPVIVGVADLADGYCNCDGDVWAMPPTPFKLTFSGTLTLTALRVGPDQDGQAQDVNTPQGSDPLEIVGFTDCAGIQDKEGCFRAGICREPMDAVHWSPATRTALNDLGTSGSRARGVNDAQQIAGWGRQAAEDCIQRAPYWATPGSSYIDLGATMPSGQTGDPSRAEAINDSSPPQVVGWNSGAGGALLWESPESTPPTVLDFNSSGAIGGCNTKWALEEAHDINENDWIITWGQNTEGTTYTWAILLTPWPACAVDIIPTGCVDTDDIIAVVGAWGACPIGTICNADVNGDCVVNTDDLIAVNVAWGCSPCGGGFAGHDPRTLEELIEIILESGAPGETIAEIIEQLIANWP